MDNNKWPRLIGTGRLRSRSVSKIKEINPSAPDHIMENPFVETCDGFWSNYFTSDPKTRGISCLSDIKSHTISHGMPDMMNWLMG